MARLKRIVLYLLCAAGLGFLGVLALDTAMWIIPPERGWAFWRWDSTGPISVGDGFSIAFQTRTAHPMLAEYDQRVFIFGGTEREGRHLATWTWK